MARTPKINWEAYKDQLLVLRHGERKTLHAIAGILQEKFGTTVTTARLSQIFTGWSKEFNQDLKEKQELRSEIGTDAN